MSSVIATNSYSMEVFAKDTKLQGINASENHLVLPVVANNQELMLKIYLKDGLGNPAIENKLVELVDVSGYEQLTFIGN